MNYRDESLQTKTEEFWKLSSAARGRGEKITTGDAIGSATDLLDALNPARTLWQRIATLQTNLIAFGGCKEPRKGKRRRSAIHTNITELRK